jgi:XTP/dITP diphosphohydrolase
VKGGAVLLVGTRNEGKLAEIRQLLSDLPLVLLSLHDFPEVRTVGETGGTVEENAILKAAGYASQTQVLTLADDSGLEVDALGGAPGVRSARYAGDHANDSQRIQKLLAELMKIGDTNRGARFMSAIGIADKTGAILNLSVGECSGKIAFDPRGAGGFGYDPVFIPDGYELSFAELNPEIKNQISHRARALRQAREYLLSLTRRLAAS